MTLYEFRALDEQEQFEALWASGILLRQRTDELYLYTVYSLGDFYVELKRHKQLNALQGLRMFKTTTLLDPYLDAIDISGII